MKRVLEHKLVFLETKDIEETSLALEAYKKACACGRGAVFFSVARGKVAEGIDFSGHLGRAVVLVGVPFQYTRSRVLLARLEYLRAKYHIEDSDFLNFDALRQASQCVGRIVRSKSDYGLMVFADQRYGRSDKRTKLPRWIQQFMISGEFVPCSHALVSLRLPFLPALLSFSHVLLSALLSLAPVAENMNLSTESALHVARTFLRAMASPHDRRNDVGVTLLDEENVRRFFGSMPLKRPVGSVSSVAGAVSVRAGMSESGPQSIVGLAGLIPVTAEGMSAQTARILAQSASGTV